MAGNDQEILALERQILALLLKLMATTNQVLDSLTAASGAVASLSTVAALQQELLQELLDGQSVNEEMAATLDQIRDYLAVLAHAATDVEGSS